MPGAMGLVRYAAGDTSRAADDLAQALEQGEGYDQACRLLGLSPDDQRTREGKRRLSEAEVRELLKQALAQVPDRMAAADTSSTAAAGAQKKSPDYRIAAARSGSDATLTLGAFLYWKE